MDPSPIFYQFPNFHGAIAPWENIVQFTSGVANDGGVINISFIWTPPRDGQLTISSVVAQNGTYWYRTQHGCIESGVDLELNFAMAVSDDPDADLIVLDGQDSLLVQRDWDPGCTNKTATGVASQTIFLKSFQPTSVTGGVPLVVIVQIFLAFVGTEITGQVDFLNDGKSVNVTGLILNLA